jgi:prevent-host-death family protein
MRELGIAQGKNRFSELVDQAEQGHTIVITRKGKAVAELRPHAAAPSSDVVERILGRNWMLGCSPSDLIREGRR